MKNWMMLFLWLGGLVAMTSCADTPMPQQEIGDILNDTRSCEADAQYLAGLKTFLADHYQVASTAITLSYSGINAEGDNVFPFTASLQSQDIDGQYVVDDLCLDYDAEFIVEDDLVGI